MSYQPIACRIADLARWQDWDSLAQVAQLFGREKYRDPAIEQAIVGYLLTCPRPQAAEELARLRGLAPQRVGEIEKSLSFLDGKS